MRRRIIRGMHPSHVRPQWHAEEVLSLMKRPPEFSSDSFVHTFNATGGRFFDCAQNDTVAYDHPQNASVTRRPGL